MYFSCDAEIAEHMRLTAARIHFWVAIEVRGAIP